MVEGQGSYEQSSRKILSIKQIRSLSYNEVRYSDSFVVFDAFCKFQHLRQAGLVLFVLGVSTRRTGVGRGLLQGGRYSTWPDEQLSRSHDLRRRLWVRRRNYKAGRDILTCIERQKRHY